MKGTKCPHCGKDVSEPVKLSQADQFTGFDNFWDRVPHKIGKKQARGEWMKLMRAGIYPGTIIDALPEYRAKEEARAKADGPAFQAHAPHRWLRDRRFEDEPAPTPAPKEVTTWELRQREAAVKQELAKIKRKNQFADGHRERLTDRGIELSEPYWGILQKVQTQIIAQADK